MKKIKRGIIFSLLLGFQILLYSCEKKTDVICKNLRSIGVADTALLYGEWSLEYSARTLNGKKSINKEEINKGDIKITDTGTVFLHHVNTAQFKYNVSNKNNISLSLQFTTLVFSSEEEQFVSNALEHAYCYVVKDNKLLIHFKENEKKNLIIFTKKQ